MILHRPGDRAVGLDLGGLHGGLRIRCQHRRPRRERLNLVEVYRQGIEYRSLALVHRVLAPGRGQRDAAPDPDFATRRIRPHRAACRNRENLQTPAASEQRRLGLKHCARKLDLPLDLRPAIVDIERRAGDRHTVIAFEAADRQVRAGIGRIADVDDSLGQQPAQNIRIPVAHRASASLDLPGAQFRGVAVALGNKENAGSREV